MSAVQAARRAHSLRRTIFSVAACVVVVDQLTKYLAVTVIGDGVSKRALDGIVYWTVQRNPGSAFGLFRNFPVAFTLIAAAIAGWILARAHRVTDRWMAIALALVLGGALGNLIDRLARSPGPFRGRVVDFIDLRVWPVFNLADSAVVVGAILLFLSSLRGSRDAANV